MNNINKNELKNVVGGAISLSGALISALKGYFGTVLSIGQSLGSAIRRIANGNLCNY